MRITHDEHYGTRDGALPWQDIMALQVASLASMVTLPSAWKQATLPLLHSASSFAGTATQSWSLSPGAYSMSENAISVSS